MIHLLISFEAGHNGPMLFLFLIMWSISWKARYVIFIVNSNAWLYIALITTDLYEISCYIGPRFKGILRNYVCPQYVWNNLLGYAEIATYQYKPTQI